MKYFCPNCGARLRPGLKFCPRCGYRLDKKISGQASQQPRLSPQNNQPQPAQRRARQASPRKPWSRSKKITVSVIGVIVVLLIGLFVYGRHYYDQVHQVGRIVTAIRRDDNAKLANLVATDNPDVKVNSSSVKSITNYYRQHASDLSMVENTLLHQGSIKGVSLIQDGHYFLLFPKYKLQVSSYQPAVETNHAGSKIYVDNKYVTTAKASDIYGYLAKLAPMLGGSHVIKIEAQAAGHSLSSNANVNLWSNRRYNCNIKTANLAVLGPEGSEIYIGNKDYGQIKDGQIRDFDAFQYNNETSAYLVYKANGRKFTSKTVNISEAVAQDKENDEDSDADDEDSDLREAQDKTNHYDSKMTDVVPVFDGAPSLDTVEDLLQNCFQKADADRFVGGSSNKYYKSFHKLAYDFNHSDKIDDWNAEPDINNVYPIGNGVYECNAKIDYEFDHPSNTHIQVAHYPHVTFKRSDGEFKILSVGNGKIIYDQTKK